MTWLALMIYLGGVGAAYRRERQRFGRFKSAAEAIFWPAGIGYRIARDFYINEDWPDEIANRADSDKPRRQNTA